MTGIKRLKMLIRVFEINNEYFESKMLQVEFCDNLIKRCKKSVFSPFNFPHLICFFPFDYCHVRFPFDDGYKFAILYMESFYLINLYNTD